MYVVQFATDNRLRPPPMSSVDRLFTAMKQRQNEKHNLDHYNTWAPQPSVTSLTSSVRDPQQQQQLHQSIHSESSTTLPRQWEPPYPAIPSDNELRLKHKLRPFSAPAGSRGNSNNNHHHHHHSNNNSLSGSCGRFLSGGASLCLFAPGPSVRASSPVIEPQRTELCVSALELIAVGDQRQRQQQQQQQRQLQSEDLGGRQLEPDAVPAERTPAAGDITSLSSVVEVQQLACDLMLFEQQQHIQRATKTATPTASPRSVHRSQVGDVFAN